MDLEQLERLQKLKESGALTEEEFQREKQKLLQENNTPKNQTINNTYSDMKQCKYCRQMIPKQSNVCPYCGIKVYKPKKQTTFGDIIAYILIIVGIFVFFNGFIDDTKTSTTSTKNYSATSSSTKSTTSTSTSNINSSNKNPWDSKFDISTTTTTTDGYSTYIEGTITNKTGKKMSYVQVIFNLYDENGAQVGTAMDNINNLDAYGKWKFKAISLDFDNKAKKYKLSEISGF